MGWSIFLTFHNYWLQKCQLCEPIREQNAMRLAHMVDVLHTIGPECPLFQLVIHYEFLVKWKEFLPMSGFHPVSPPPPPTQNLV